MMKIKLKKMLIYLKIHLKMKKNMKFFLFILYLNFLWKKMKKLKIKFELLKKF